MKPIIVANWKANKNIQETIDFVNQTKSRLEEAKNTEVVLCSSFTSLPTLASLLTDSSIKVGAQNVSDHLEGAFTGEVAASMLKGLVTHCIVGHSERRRYYSEKEDQVGEKVKNLVLQNITPVLCISDINQMDNYLAASASFKQNASKIVFVYEPPGAISGGGDYHPESPAEAAANAAKISEKIGSSVVVLYGGSVSENDVDKFLAEENINGVLVGKASLTAETFTQLVQKANDLVV